MWKIADRLSYTLKFVTPQFVQENRKNNGCCEAKHQTINVQDQRIGNQRPKIRVAEKLLEILKAYPFTSGKAFQDLKILKRDAQPGHRPVFKDQEVDEDRQAHDIKVTVSPNLFPYLAEAEPFN